MTVNTTTVIKTNIYRFRLKIIPYITYFVLWLPYTVIIHRIFRYIKYLDNPFILSNET